MKKLKEIKLFLNDLNIIHSFNKWYSLIHSTIIDHISDIILGTGGSNNKQDR